LPTKASVKYFGLAVGP